MQRQVFVESRQAKPKIHVSANDVEYDAAIRFIQQWLGYSKMCDDA